MNIAEFLIPDGKNIFNFTGKLRHILKEDGHLFFTREYDKTTLIKKYFAKNDKVSKIIFNSIPLCCEYLICISGKKYTLVLKDEATKEEIDMCNKKLFDIISNEVDFKIVFIENDLFQKTINYAVSLELINEI